MACGVDSASGNTQSSVTNTHLEDTNKVLFVNSEEMAVVFSQDDGGSTRRIVQQSQLPKVLTLVQRGYQALQMACSAASRCLMSDTPEVYYCYHCNQRTYLPMRDHVYRAFPDDVPGSAFVSLTEHCITNKTIGTNISCLHTSLGE